MRPPARRKTRRCVVRDTTGAGRAHGIAKIWKRREISGGSYYDQSHDRPPHPYAQGEEEELEIGCSSSDDSSTGERDAEEEVESQPLRSGGDGGGDRGSSRSPPLRPGARSRSRTGSEGSAVFSHSGSTEQRRPAGGGGGKAAGRRGATGGGKSHSHSPQWSLSADGHSSVPALDLGPPSMRAGSRSGLTAAGSASSSEDESDDDDDSSSGGASRSSSPLLKSKSMPDLGGTTGSRRGNAASRRGKRSRQHSASGAHSGGSHFSAGESSSDSSHQSPTNARSTIPSPTLAPSQGSASRYSEEFNEKRRLGKGGQGTVFVAHRSLDGIDYAVKKVRLPQRGKDRDRVLREVKSLAQLEHVNIVRYYNAWIEKIRYADLHVMFNPPSPHSSREGSSLAFSRAESSTGYTDTTASGMGSLLDGDAICEVLFIQMKLYQQETLAQYLAPGARAEVDVIEAFEIVSQILDGLAYVHGEGLIHRDLKPPNIFRSLDSGLPWPPPPLPSLFPHSVRHGALAAQDDRRISGST